MKTPISRWLLRGLVGKERDPHAPGVFHKISLIALFAWVGLGADGLSSSCYGPAEAYLALASHPYFSLIIALASVMTVLLISASYMQVIELFPSGGGGYLVASKLLSPSWGMVSGCALLIDYVLTIAISVASGADALFSFLPLDWQRYRLGFAIAVVIVLIVLNLRGVKESVLPLVPIFLTFLLTHLFVIGHAVFTHIPQLGSVAHGLVADTRSAHAELGWLGVLFLLLRAYSMGAGTYTGIEAVSNGLALLREPKAKTGKRTMRYMAVSLSIAVLGLMVAYLVYGVSAEPGKTLNASVCDRVVAAWPAPWGDVFVWVTLLSEATLLFVAAQTGFFGGPSVLANMAKDRWVPSRFALLSNRLVVQNGILLIGSAALVTILLTQASVHILVVLYSINVFITFLFSQLGITRYWLRSRIPLRVRLRKLAVSVSGLSLTSLILVSVVVMKFDAGGWITLMTTLALTIVVLYIKREYRGTAQRLNRLNDLVSAVEISLGHSVAPTPAAAPATGDGRTAVMLVNGYGGIGLHSVLAVIRLFGRSIRRFVFVQVGVIDAAAFKGAEEIAKLDEHTQSEVDRYVQLMQRHGYEAEGVTVTGLDVDDEIAKMAPDLCRRYPGALFFGGQLVFQNDSLITRLLYNFTVFDIQRRLYQQGIQFIILPIRV